MKFTLSLLKQHLETSATLDEICDALTRIGLEVESVEDPAKLYGPFAVAYIEKADRHPDADKLQVCSVKTVKGTLQVVCGASNARAGMKAIFAPDGSYIPGLDVTLKKTKIRGVESNGMLVSEKEMCLSNEHAGIIEVDERFEIGTPMAEVYGINDPVIEINLTPNRADCTGVYGIARDLAATGLGHFKPVSSLLAKSTFKSEIAITIEDKDGCPLFLGREIRGVRNGPSPEWLQKMLKAIGLRPISALVDITNFMSVAYGQPMHVFDKDKLKGNFVVKPTKKGEKLEALTGKTYVTPENVVGIYDDSGLIDFGGMMGDINTCTSETTVNVFVESAYFNPLRIARAGRDMQLISDARYRFERGVDPEFTPAAMEIATNLILEFCGGESSEVVKAGEVPNWKREIDYDPGYFEQRIGFALSQEAQFKILKDIGFEISGENPYKITPPSWRSDIMGKADITEEIIRIYGYENIPAVSVLGSNTGTIAETALFAKARKIRNTLTARGFYECVTWSFMNAENAALFGLTDPEKIKSLKLVNAISSEIDVMRPSILPNLIQGASQNAARGYEDLALCEVGPVFESVKPEGQKYVAAGIRAGVFAPRHWDQPQSRAVDVFDVKADVIAALEACGLLAANAQISRTTPDYYHPGRSAVLRLGPMVLAYFGEIHPLIAEAFDISVPLTGFEIFLENFPETKKKTGTEKSLLKLEPLQPLRRDFAFLVDDKISAEDLIRAAKAADKSLIESAYIFDIYKGKGVEDGKKSVALSIHIQPREKSLNEQDLEAISKAVTQQVLEKTGGILRG